MRVRRIWTAKLKSLHVEIIHRLAHVPTGKWWRTKQPACGSGVLVIKFFLVRTLSSGRLLCTLSRQYSCTKGNDQHHYNYKSFAGDFQSLLFWWQTHKCKPILVWGCNGLILSLTQKENICFCQRWRLMSPSLRRLLPHRKQKFQRRKSQRKRAPRRHRHRAGRRASPRPRRVSPSPASRTPPPRRANPAPQSPRSEVLPQPVNDAASKSAKWFPKRMWTTMDS